VAEKVGQAIHITGVVQGVGFRPFVYNLATRCDLSGWVNNSPDGVHIQVDGSPNGIGAFLTALENEPPPLAHIESITAVDCQPEGYISFEIVPSTHAGEINQAVSPDVTLCEDCQQELLDPTDRRFQYPFINCTNCGPRFTIIRAMPYDRPATTMSEFEMCPECREEYSDPSNRRFHAQPIACPECGPSLWLSDYAGNVLARGDNALRQAVDLLRAGSIAAIKGLGGFHLACDAANDEAVRELRRRKGRIDKPFALMMRDINMVEQYCIVSNEECDLLTSKERPVVILQRLPDAGLSPEIAPGQRTIGVMLPYTPLHLLLFEGETPIPLVMTSGNLSGEPIITENGEVLRALEAVADVFLLHDREIHIRADDSVVRHASQGVMPIRRSRGYVPTELTLPLLGPNVLAVGAELKNTICLTRDSHAVVSQHIGDVDTLGSLQAFEETTAHFEDLYGIRPDVLACDLHPDYLPSKFAHQRAMDAGIPLVAVQHHHAHIASCLAEHGHPGNRPVIGVAFDGMGLGTDGTIWGGEFLVANYADFQRVSHLKTVPLPGGDKATHHISRCGLAYLYTSHIEPDVDLPLFENMTVEELRIIKQQMQTGVNAPLTSSMGRLFDAVASILGLRQVVQYEGQAAIELEAAVDPLEHRVYPFEVGNEIDVSPMLHMLLADLRNGVSIGEIAARFHNCLSQMIVENVLHIREMYPLGEVVLSGGVFQNVTLLSQTTEKLQRAGFKVLTHHKVPPNDGGLSLGQAVVAMRRLAGE